MAKLHAVVENLDDVPEALRECYSEMQDNDKKTWFVLQLDDDVRVHPTVKGLTVTLEKFKVANQELKTKLSELEGRVGKIPDDFDPDKWTRLHEVEKQFNELKAAGDDPDAKRAHEAEVASFKKSFDERTAKLTKQMTDGFAERDAQLKASRDRIHQLVIRDGLARLLAENGVKKETLPFVQAKLERAAKVVDSDNGDPVMVFDTDLGEVPGTEYIPKWVTTEEAKPFVEPPRGGGADGGASRGRANEPNPWSAAFWNMSKQAEILKKDPMRADRMAKAAGHKKAPGALPMDAK